MNIEMHQVECQHPFGDGIHVLILTEPEVIQALFYKMEIHRQIKQEYLGLKALADSSGKAASKCGVYIGKAPLEMGGCYAVVRMVVKPEDEFESNVIALLVEKGHEKLARQVVDLMRIDMQKL
jgi:hypothetical protein